MRYTLEGSVRKAAGKVRITGQLIDAVTGAHLWADRFERDLTDVFALQDEVTVAVVSAIQPKLLQTEIAMAARRRPENLTAYDFFLRAWSQFYLTTREGFAEAIRLAHRALELDPGFGLAAALAGAGHMQNVLLGYAVDPQFDREEAIRLLHLALSINDDDPDAVAVAAVTSAYMVGDPESEIEMADRAIALNPNSFVAWSCRGQVYRIAGRPEVASSARRMSAHCRAGSFWPSTYPTSQCRRATPRANWCAMMSTTCRSMRSEAASRRRRSWSIRRALPRSCQANG